MPAGEARVRWAMPIAIGLGPFRPVSVRVFRIGVPHQKKVWDACGRGASSMGDAHRYWIGAFQAGEREGVS